MEVELTMTTDLRSLDLAGLTRDTGLSIRVRSGDEELVYRDGEYAASGRLGIDDTPVDRVRVLSEVEVVHITTGAGEDFELTDPELLRKLAPLIPAVRKWAWDKVHGGSPTARVLVGLTYNGYVPGPSFAHGNQHPAAYLQRVLLKDFGVDTTVSVAVCPGCRIVHVGM